MTIQSETRPQRKLQLQREQQHLKISARLKERIRTGELRPGDQLPSEAELCAEFNTSRGPVRQAMAALRADGAISSGRGRRSVVLDSCKSENFDSIVSVTSWLSQHGCTPGQKTLWLARRPAPDDAALALGIEAGSPLVFVHRLRTANGVPLMIERQYFPIDIGQKILGFDADAGSIHAHLRSEGIEFDNVHRELAIGQATEEDAELLGVEPGAPLWCVILQISNHSGDRVEYSQYRYRADSVRFGMNSVRGGASPLEVIVNGANCGAGTA